MSNISNYRFSTKNRLISSSALNNDLFVFSSFACVHRDVDPMMTFANRCDTHFCFCIIFSVIHTRSQLVTVLMSIFWLFFFVVVIPISFQHYYHFEVFIPPPPSPIRSLQRSKWSSNRISINLITSFRSRGAMFVHISAVKKYYSCLYFHFIVRAFLHELFLDGIHFVSFI